MALAVAWRLAPVDVGVTEVVGRHLHNPDVAGGRHAAQLPVDRQHIAGHGVGVRGEREASTTSLALLCQCQGIRDQSEAIVEPVDCCLCAIEAVHLGIRGIRNLVAWIEPKPLCDSNR